MLRAFRLLLTIGLLSFLALPGAAAAEKWEIQYFYDVMDREFTILDLKFPSAQRGIASGFETDGNKVRPKCVVTSDGGENWANVKIKESGLSLYFLDETIGWMVTEKGLWKTVESGRSWRKISKKKGMIRVHFTDELRGFAVGREKSIWETGDGGKTWTPLPVVEEIPTTEEYTNFTWLEFANPKYALIAGFSERPRRSRSGLPDWMEPKRTSERRQWPATSIIVQTNDGGGTWKHSVTSMFGHISRFRLRPDGTGLSLVRFQHAFDWPSEVYRVDVTNRVTERTYRHKNRSITDMILAGSSAYLAGFVPAGTLEQSPIPGRLVILGSTDLENWEEMEVDYRAYAHRAVLAASGEGNVWVATDTGMILRLQRN